MDSKGKTTEFLKKLLEEELLRTNEVQTLFRSNSFATKAVDIYMKLHGKGFIQKVLDPMLAYARNPETDFELDPEKIGRNGDLNQNILNLERCSGIFLGALLKNIHLMPL